MKFSVALLALATAADVRSNIDAQATQTDREAAPTARPTAFPTKDTASAEGFGTTCTDATTGFSKPVGWVGPGPAQYYCNVWKFDVAASTFAKSEGIGASFKGSQRVCSIEERSEKFCSHVTCERVEVIQNGESRMVIQVTSDHKETKGGNHKCGYARHSAASSAGRPACDCVCDGARAQDAAGFARTLSEITKDLTITPVSIDTRNNANNLHSKHSNLDYNENDHTYAGEEIGHHHSLIETAPTPAPVPVWTLAINVNPSDGHSMGYGSPDWFGDANVGTAATALSADYVSTAAYAEASKYVAIVRHSGSSSCEAVKVFKWADETKTFKNHLATQSTGMAATPAATLVSEYVPAGLKDVTKDPIFGNSGDLQVNYWYSNNGVRMCLTGAYGYPTTGNTDDIHGLGNEFGAGTSSFGGSSSYEHDVAQRYNQDCHGASCPLMGTDVGSSLNPSSVSYQYAVYTSDSETTFACEGKTLY